MPDVAAQLDEAARLLAYDDAGPVVAGSRWPEASTDPVSAAAGLLYSLWYVQSTPPPALTGPVGPGEHDLPQALRAAHAGSERFAGGWRAAQVSTRGRVRAVEADAPEGGGEVRLLGRADYVVPARPGLRAEPGDALLVHERRDHLDPGGFWVTHTAAWPPPAATVLARVYWRVGPAGGPPLVRRLTALLLDAQAPAALKVLADPAAFGRADAAVLYLPREWFPQLAAGLLATAAALAEHLSDPPPRLTCQLARGVGVAESALDGPSFGQTRCRLIAEAVHEGGGRRTPADAVAAIRARFAAAGIDPDRPHLAAPATAADPYAPTAPRDGHGR